MARGMIDRHFIAVLDDALETARIVNLTGPRQVGKTTLVRDLHDKGDYHTLDDEVFSGAVEDDPMGLLLSLAEDARQRGRSVVIDEVQRSKNIVLALKRIVDMDRRKGQFILPGSSNIFALSGAADSLAGRQLTIKLCRSRRRRQTARDRTGCLNGPRKKRPA